MSAFVVHSATIDAVMTWAVEHRLSVWNAKTDNVVHVDCTNAEEIGRMLLDENVRSVVHRYQGSSPDHADSSKSEAAAYKLKRFPTPLTPVEVIKLCRCIDYQSCETEDWHSTFAHAVLHAIILSAIHLLPGYDAAPWGLHSHTETKLKHAGQIKLSSLPRGRA